MANSYIIPHFSQRDNIYMLYEWNKPEMKFIEDNNINVMILSPDITFFEPTEPKDVINYYIKKVRSTSTWSCRVDAFKNKNTCKTFPYDNLDIISIYFCKKKMAYSQIN